MPCKPVLPFHETSGQPTTNCRLQTPASKEESPLLLPQILPIKVINHCCSLLRFFLGEKKMLKNASCFKWSHLLTFFTQYIMGSHRSAIRSYLLVIDSVGCEGLFVCCPVEVAYLLNLLLIMNKYPNLHLLFTFKIFLKEFCDLLWIGWWISSQKYGLISYFISVFVHLYCPGSNGRGPDEFVSVGFTPNFWNFCS